MDTIFLLLFFFLCIAILQPETLSLSLSGKGGEKIEKYQTITITAAGVTGLAEVNPQLPVVIEAASEVPFGKVNDVLRALQEKGVNKINIR